MVGRYIGIGASRLPVTFRWYLLNPRWLGGSEPLARFSPVTAERQALADALIDAGVEPVATIGVLRADVSAAVVERGVRPDALACTTSVRFDAFDAQMGLFI